MIRGSVGVRARWITIGVSLLGFSGCQTAGLGSGLRAPSSASWRVPVAPVRSVAPQGRETALPGPTAIPEVEVEEVDRILYSYATTDPILREATDLWINRWETVLSVPFSRYLERMSRYGSIVERELEARGLPASLRYLPLVESGYSPLAVSRVGATGLWQLMGPTARELGLTVNSIVDDRADPMASTTAALDYLERLHEEFGSWMVALAAYNVGPGRVRRVLARVGSGDWAPSEPFLEIRRHLPRETREFIPRFLAAAALAENPKAYGFSEVEPEPMSYDEVGVPDATSLDVVADAAGVPEESIRSLNPQYLRGYTPFGEARTVRVPTGTGVRFAANFALIPPDARLSFFEHVVSQGETFSHIARTYGLPVSELTDTNRNVDPRRLQIGMTVVVPRAGMVTTRGLGAGSGG